jgi:hypothetical protein
MCSVKGALVTWSASASSYWPDKVCARHPAWRTCCRHVIAMAQGWLPALIALPGVLVAVRIGVTDADP